MITSQQVSDTNVAEIKVDGPISSEDYEAMLPTVERLLADFEQINLLLTVDNIGEVSPKAAWEDLQMAKLLGRFNKMAVVTDKDWLDKLMNAANSALSVDMRHFEPGQRDAALQWVSA